MDRGLVVFGVLFLAIPLALAIGVFALPTAAFGLTLALIAVLAFGFLCGIAFIDVEGGGA